MKRKRTICTIHAFHRSVPFYVGTHMQGNVTGCTLPVTPPACLQYFSNITVKAASGIPPQLIMKRLNLRLKCFLLQHSTLFLLICMIVHD